MKRIFLFLLALIMALYAGGCSPRIPVTTQASQLQKLIMFKADDENISAFELDIDLIKHSISVDAEPLYEIADSSSLRNSRIFPQYMSSNVLILRDSPINTKYDNIQISEDDDILYFEDYTLQFNNENYSFQIYENNESICGNTTLIHENTKMVPACFFVDKDGKIAILCMSSASLIDTEMITLLYAENDGSLLLEKMYEYPTIWEEYDISKIRCPNYMSNHTNTLANPALGSFLYNETTKIFEISPYDSSVECILEEKNVTSDMPYLDAHREYYSFFRDVGYQDGYYIATFPALNSLSGAYAVIYSNKGEFMGGILCSKDNTIFFDNENTELDKIDGTYVPQIYVPSYFTNK